jgi:hypothetical protein
MRHLRNLRALFAVFALALTAVLVGAVPASADASSSCSGGGQSAFLKVYESPTEGDVTYVKVDTTAQADVAASNVDLYRGADGLTFVATRDLSSYPIDGDGWWNYRAYFNYQGSATRVYFYVKFAGSTAYCIKSVLI